MVVRGCASSPTARTLTVLDPKHLTWPRRHSPARFFIKQQAASKALKQMLSCTGSPKGLTLVTAYSISEHVPALGGSSPADELPQQSRQCCGNNTVTARKEGSPQRFSWLRASLIIAAFIRKPLSCLSNTACTHTHMLYRYGISGWLLQCMSNYAQNCWSNLYLALGLAAFISKLERHLHAESFHFCWGH